MTTTTTSVPTSSTTITVPARTPAISLSATSSLDPGQQVTVHGDGFAPNATIAVVECGPGAWGVDRPAACDNTHAGSATTDVSGRFEVKFAVLINGAAAPYDFSPSDPAVSCPPATYTPPGCVVVAYNVVDRAERASVPVSLNLVVHPPTTIVLTQGVGLRVTAPPPPPPPPPSPVATVEAATVTRQRPPTLALTGSSRTTLVLAALGLLLVDVGYHALSATWSRRRLR